MLINLVILGIDCGRLHPDENFIIFSVFFFNREDGHGIMNRGGH